VKKVEDWTNNPGQKLVTAASFRTWPGWRDARPFASLPS